MFYITYLSVILYLAWCQLLYPRYTCTVQCIIHKYQTIQWYLVFQWHSSLKNECFISLSHTVYAHFWKSQHHREWECGTYILYIFYNILSRPSHYLQIKRTILYICTMVYFPLPKEYFSTSILIETPNPFANWVTVCKLYQTEFVYCIFHPLLISRHVDYFHFFNNQKTAIDIPLYLS